MCPFGFEDYRRVAYRHGGLPSPGPTVTGANRHGGLPSAKWWTHRDLRVVHLQPGIVED